MKPVFQNLRLLARCMWVYILAWTGFLRRAEETLRERGAILTLTLHRVLDDASYDATNSLPGIIIRQRTFVDLVDHIRNHYQPTALADAVPGDTAPGLRTVITFDDGWQDNYTTAFPVVRTAGLPITIFVCPAVLGHHEPFWPERAIRLLSATMRDATPGELSTRIDGLKERTDEQRDQFFKGLSASAEAHSSNASFPSVDRTLSWNQVHEMHRAGVGFGSHTNTHQILTTISPDTARTELAESKIALERMLGIPCTHFAYPNGNWSPATRSLVEKAGFTKAVTTDRGPWTPNSDPLSIPRLNVSESNVVGLTGHFWPAMFQYTVVWKAWRAMQHQSTEPRPASQAAFCAGN